MFGRSLWSVVERLRSRVPFDWILQKPLVLGMTVVADQVETEEQMDYLVSVGCELAQGFVFSAPVTFDNMLEKLDR